MEQMGLLHLYYGDGKGKTTAAMGLALRALGHGRRVVILQFLKDGSSGEIEMLRRCGAVVYACPNAKFTWLMTDAERAVARRTNTQTLQTILQGSFDLLVLVEGKSMRDIARFVAEKLSTLEGVLSTSTHFHLKTYKKNGCVFEAPAQNERLAVAP